MDYQPLRGGIITSSGKKDRLNTGSAGICKADKNIETPGKEKDF